MPPSNTMKHKTVYPPQTRKTITVIN